MREFAGGFVGGVATSAIVLLLSGEPVIAVVAAATFLVLAVTGGWLASRW